MSAFRMTGPQSQGWGSIGATADSNNLKNNSRNINNNSKIGISHRTLNSDLLRKLREDKSVQISKGKRANALEHRRLRMLNEDTQTEKEIFDSVNHGESSFLSTEEYSERFRDLNSTVFFADILKTSTDINSRIKALNYFQRFLHTQKINWMDIVINTPHVVELFMQILTNERNVDLLYDALCCVNHIATGNQHHIAKLLEYPIIEILLRFCQPSAKLRMKEMAIR